MPLTEITGVERPTHSSVRLLAGLWVLVCLSVLVWVAFQAPGWDLAIYCNAIRSLQLGRDPYMENIQLQEQAARSGSTNLPFSYLYPPITLPVLRILGRVQASVAGLFYWSVYAFAVLIELRVGLVFATIREKRIFAYIAPIAVFFPGLLADGTVLSGNIAYILYAAMLLTAVVGWRHNHWRYFYFTVLTASCVKAPFLIWVMLPALSARRQWTPATLTTLAGVALYSAQALLWPSLFRHYLNALRLNLSLEHDFGCGPSGLLMQWRVAHHHSYISAGTVLYVVYAPLLTILLLFLARRYFAGAFTLKQWAPVLLVGIALLNPRIIEYDAVPITIPLALICWRAIVSLKPLKPVSICLACLLVSANGFGLRSWELHKIIDGPILVGVLLAGSWSLFRAKPDLAYES